MRSGPSFAEKPRQGDARQWGLVQIRKKGLRDMGGALSSEQAHQIATGAETLALRQRVYRRIWAEVGYNQFHPASDRFGASALKWVDVGLKAIW